MADPALLGMLYDFPQGDGGASFEEAVRLGLDAVGAPAALGREVEFVTRQTRGLPSGSILDVERGFAALVDGDVLAIVGPSISDNGLAVRDWADAAGVACVNYTGGERTRSQWMFHYQVGSLAEEPIVLAEHVLAGGGRSVAVVRDRSPVGRGYVDAFEAACERFGLDVAAVAAVSATAAEDDSAVADGVARLRAAEPDALVYLGLGVSARAVAVALTTAGWSVPVVTNSALMFGYARRDWRDGWDGWVYVDTVSDANAERQALHELSPRTAAGPVGVAAYDIGRLLGTALASAEHLTRSGLRDALESVKRLPAASGKRGTTMGFGVYDHGALKGEYLVKRVWRDGRTVEWEG
jgi:ABC-type branched-subunit amino acid transport system substrate-binding protein